MDRGARSRKTPKKDAPRPTKLPLRLPGRDKRLRADVNPDSDENNAQQLSPVTGGKINRARDSRDDNEIVSPVESDPGARSYAVTNVGANGVLYLKPSRMPHANPTLPTPPSSSHAQLRRAYTDQSLARQSDVSALTARMHAARAGGTVETGLSVPPLSLANSHSKRRTTRSHSFSNASDNARAPTIDSTEFQILLNGAEFNARPKSSLDLLGGGGGAGVGSGGLLDLRIPHYRIGTPQFSERGTAYMHNSQYNSQYSSVAGSEGFRSSIFSRAEYDKLFPAPPGASPAGVVPSRNSAAAYLHPLRAAASRTPPTPSVRTTVSGITPTVFDKIEANPNDPSLMRYSPVDGRVIAATPARLIVLITSPQFLDYELLSDFFLTYRAFLSSHDLLDYLMTRMKWALDKNEDSGRIVRVRTFVALRHWILNYFLDDFVGDYILRERLCMLVNQQCRSLSARSDKGGSDLNILAELKKCWRRTCSGHWPLPDGMEVGPSVDITPGRRTSPQQDAASVASIAQSFRGGRRGSQRPISEATEGSVQTVQGPSARDVAARALGSERMSFEVQRASIPASPMSENSLEVLSCSVPFLRHMVPSSLGGGAPKAHPKDKSRTSITQRGRPQNRRGRTSHQHKRSGSFSDALRDERTPLPSPKPDSVDIRSLPAITFTGGLVRGLLLQPSPSRLDVLIPVSPTHEVSDPFSSDGADDAGQQDRQPHRQGMKRMVGDVRRAFNSRRPQSGSPTRSTASDSSGGVQSSHQQADRKRHRSSKQLLKVADRYDMLGARIEESYHEVFQARQDPSEARDRQPSIPEAEETPQVAEFALRLPPNLNRLDSRVTASSRSIVIVDDTKQSSISGGKAPSSNMSLSMKPRPLFRSLSGTPGQDEKELLADTDSSHGRTSTAQSNLSAYRRHSADDGHFHELLAVPVSWQPDKGGARLTGFDPGPSFQDRASSNAYPSGLDMPPIRNQLRRRPGGDLRAADNIQQLEPLPHEHETWRSFSATTHSFATSQHQPFSRDLSGTHFDPRTFGPENTMARTGQDPLGRSHASQPMLTSSRLDQSFLVDPGEDEHSDGVEDALMKLEGRYGSKSETLLSTGGTRQADGDGLQWERVGKELDFGSVTRASTLPEDENLMSPGTDRQGASIYQVSDTDIMSGEYAWQSSRTSAPSIFTAGTQPPPPPVPPPQSPLPELPQHATRFPISGGNDSVEPSPVSARFGKKREQEGSQTPMSGGSGGKRFAGLSTIPAPKSPLSQGSFLLDDGDSLSEISTEMGESVENDDSVGIRSFFWDADDTVSMAKDKSATKPRVRFPPTPPSTGGAPRSSKSRDAGSSGSRSPQLQRRKMPGPLKMMKENPSSSNLLTSPASSSKNAAARDLESFELAQLNPDMPFSSNATAPLSLSSTSSAPPLPAPPPPPGQTAVEFTHLPFILAFESSVLAEQLTIVEKDALDEISWKDLVALNWQQKPIKTTNWVDFLQNAEESANRQPSQPIVNGIDIAITRFNLAVKWVVSEVLLTQSLTERALTITKFIHIAMNTWRLRNFASTYQITLALLSTDLARLRGTWGLVKESEKAALARLEKLCQPMRNFANLRSEMEKGSLEASAPNSPASPSGANAAGGIGPGGDGGQNEGGCIPFIGLFTHDLVFNAEKPATFTSPPGEDAGAGAAPSGDGEILVNFERYQTAAAIVKALLRLLEKSSKYVFHPHPEALSRCLWLSSLGEAEIRVRSRGLEREGG